MKILFSIVFVVYFSFAFSQVNTQIEIRDSISYLSTLDSLKSIFAPTKTALNEYELVTFSTLSYYPELIDTRISFKKARIKTTLNARPALHSLLFQSKKNRHYIIRINNHTRDSIINFNAIPFNAKLGLFGHEFAHIMDYQDKNIFQITKRLLAYSTKKTKSKFEKEIDLSAINRGLGWQLHAWSTYVLFDSNASSKYKEFKKEVYLTPSQIKDIMQNSDER